MTSPATFRTLYIKIGDGGSPEVFAHDCIINAARGIQFKSQGQDVFVPNCNAPEDPAWRTHYKTGLSATISGAGMASTDSILAFDAWFQADTAKNIKVYAEAVGHWIGAFKLTDFQIDGDPMSGNPCNFSCTIESHGAVTPYAVP